ncbi:hypothetical protein V496_06324, partial [Pseudogymnoascus sp. VKM F-4515 (FW-2607)]
YSPGALRLIQVAPLLPKTRPRLVLDEFYSIALDLDDSRPKYAAISHIWQPSPAVARSVNTRPIYIILERGETHVISWHGPMEAAIAARHLKCDYLWLDFICLDQQSSHDKKLQIKNMANIYAYCSTTIIMPGGVMCAQHPEDEAFWHTRAWTLQEAIESVVRGRSRSSVRYVLIKWPFKGEGRYTTSPVLVGEELAITELRDMLSSAGEVIYVHYGPKEEQYIEVPNRAFGTSREVTRNLVNLMYGAGEKFDCDKDPLIWRSLWVRTSSREHDLLYSSMNLFSTPIPLEVDYSHEFGSLLIQFLATMHKTTSVPYWFLISHRIPVYGWSGLLSMRPDFKMHGVPTYTVGGSKTVDAHELLCDSNCCSSLTLCVELRGASKETGHTLCAKFLKVVRVAKTETLTYYQGRRWQHVSKMLLSYNPKGDTSGRENWTFKTDRRAAVNEDSTYIPSGGESEPILNSFDCYGGPDGVVRQFNKEETWNRSITQGADLVPLHHPSLEHGSVATTALCWLDGRIGPYLAIIGFFNQHYQIPIVYFFDRITAGNIQRVGTGKLLFTERDRIKREMPWRHLQVGGGYCGTAPVFNNCDCESKEEVPLIELEQKRNPYERIMF